MSYENAPATHLLATHCVCCRRPLLDAVSVETGVGPECRKRHGYTEAQSAPQWDAFHAAISGLPEAAELGAPTSSDAAVWHAAWAFGGLETRRVANTLVRRVALWQSDRLPLSFIAIAQVINAIRALGFTTLAGVLSERVASVQLHEESGRIEVRFRYDEGAVTAVKSLPYSVRRWDRASKTWHVESSAKRFLWRALRRAFPSRLGLGDKGLFLIPGIEVAS